ncbi:Hypothetical_protein [Hexamita inflata]|uniref:Hypothetical_protein n=1 Tax=Hexamita inflata TaxID=28002 RepID=A0AA86PFS5_9EUKA|nr:Hypothetical protein HINF_LOCUS22577 [Hexamita inflata]CAI9934937.1 Hypothetical protein HINF_LOCUS22582 [Hexamita inflata]
MNTNDLDMQLIFMNQEVDLITSLINNVEEQIEALKIQKFDIAKQIKGATYKLNNVHEAFLIEMNIQHQLNNMSIKQQIQLERVKILTKRSCIEQLQVRISELEQKTIQYQNIAYQLENKDL